MKKAVVGVVLVLLLALFSSFAVSDVSAQYLGDYQYQTQSSNEEDFTAVLILFLVAHLALTVIAVIRANNMSKKSSGNKLLYCMDDIYKKKFQSFTFDEQVSVINGREKKERGILAMTILAVFLPIHFFFIGRVGLGVVFWVVVFILADLGGLIWFWQVYEIFTAAGKTQKYNIKVFEKEIERIVAFRS